MASSDALQRRQRVILFTGFGVIASAVEHLGELLAGMVGFHYNETDRLQSAGKVPLPSQGHSPLGSGLFEKIEVRISPLIERVVTEDPEPLRQGSQIAIRDKSDIHVITQMENAAG